MAHSLHFFLSVLAYSLFEYGKKKGEDGVDLLSQHGMPQTELTEERRRADEHARHWVHDRKVMLAELSILGRVIVQGMLPHDTVVGIVGEEFGIDTANAALQDLLTARILRKTNADGMVAYEPVPEAEQDIDCPRTPDPA